MKYKSFNEWIKTSKYKDMAAFNGKVKAAMIDAWDAAVHNYPEDTTKADIIEKQKIIAAAVQIQCTCDQDQIKQGFQCGCGKQKAVNSAVVDLSKYLRGLK